MWDIQQRKLTYLGFCPKDKTPQNKDFMLFFYPFSPPYFQILWFLKKIGKLFQNFSKSTLIYLFYFISLPCKSYKDICHPQKKD